ncbi:hypothetical protein MA16_Dca000113 [Dendrobium catenatum]|uniref:Uncharacterized protein n=1 Tax=Dendrobium catenatum TaxID=906689 RepID=A0A2I0WSY3_9ASPA|nr:hypothetical protein MA16_Dca000113 [Dendrobium catenatum]
MRYKSGHWCKDRTLQVLIICDDEKAEEGAKSKVVVEEEKLHLDKTEVSLNLVVRFTPNHTIKVKRVIADREVGVLIDSGDTHNFISNQVIDQLGVKLVEPGL